MRFGLVPHMVFLVDFIARGLGRGIDAGTRYWVLFGLGAMVGPMLAGALADRIGFGPALRLAFGIQAAAVLVPAISTGPGALGASSLIIGAFVPGIVPLVLGRTHELIPAGGSARQAAWSGRHHRLRPRAGDGGLWPVLPLRACRRLRPALRAGRGRDRFRPPHRPDRGAAQVGHASSAGSVVLIAPRNAGRSPRQQALAASIVGR